LIAYPELVDVPGKEPWAFKAYFPSVPRRGIVRLLAMVFWDLPANFKGPR
jgi:hypothetical protein